MGMLWPRAEKSKVDRGRASRAQCVPRYGTIRQFAFAKDDTHDLGIYICNSSCFLPSKVSNEFGLLLESICCPRGLVRKCGRYAIGLLLVIMREISLEVQAHLDSIYLLLFW